YAAGAQGTFDDLAARGFEPVRLEHGWTDDRPGGLVSRWRDPVTHQEFDVRIDTPGSQAAHAALRDWQEARHAHADPDQQRALAEGTVVVGRVRMSQADFVRGFAELVHDGRVEVGGKQLRLLSCFSARGEDPLAATLARELGVEVTGGTGKVWVYPDGTERVS